MNYLVVLDGDGDRLFAKYYDGRSKSEQSKNELILHKKTKAVTAKTDGQFGHSVSYISAIFTWYEHSSFRTISSTPAVD